ncbi:GDSL-type esterase/lipase family protein [Mucilaginibacter aquatilis]|uniref:GDSL family lipase n=1 Tax=Mucilaginibacter aquatilis TaxID=1517760 RepID=A0A6I4IR98_9SPHI|nr:GDSL-type esterase/lipase family protein [Mucilaginibacter aquatilis]MVN92474.1 GDSL family lipase [Mucilaginibacter aquatilis]
MYWYEDEVKRLEKDRLKLHYEPETLFYGSSTIRLWNSLYEDFAHLKPVNLGFGGSTLAACVWFFDRIMMAYKPKQLVVYAGDNDLGDGRHPEEVFIFFKQMVVMAAERFGNIPCYYVSLKPSPARWQIAESFKYANNLIENEIVKQQNNWRFINIFRPMLDVGGRPRHELYADDNLHLSQQGYEVWKHVIGSSL